MAGLVVAIVSLCLSLATLWLQRRDRAQRGREVQLHLVRDHQSPGLLMLSVRNRSPEPVIVQSWGVREYTHYRRWLFTRSSGDALGPRPGRHKIPKYGWRMPLEPDLFATGPLLPCRIEAFDHRSWSWPPTTSGRWVQAGVELAVGDRFFTSPFTTMEGWRRVVMRVIWS